MDGQFNPGRGLEMLAARVIDFGSHNVTQKRSWTERSKASIRMLRRQLSYCVRTASVSGRIICHFSSSIYHWPFGGFICQSTMSNNEQMKNAKWKMTNDPVAAARGSDTLKLKLELSTVR